ncbi:hypothetical protein IWW56_003829 [Coemansia sp. RSA 2131]|nr:hypothetical protein IWW56_003829 [Coemansia sp. RSA 2131]
MGNDTAPLFAPPIYHASSSPLMPLSLHTSVFRSTKSASPGMQSMCQRSGKLAPLNTSLVSSHGLKTQLPTPGESEVFMLGRSPSPAHACDIALGSPKFPISPRSSEDGETAGFTPYYMDIVQPKAPELQRQASRNSSTRWSKRASGGSIPSPKASPDGLPTPGSGSMSSSLESMSRNDNEKTAMRIKRSLTTLLQRSSSVLRRSDPNLRRLNSMSSRNRRGSRSEGPTPFVRSSSPTPPPVNAQYEPRRLQYSDLSAALTTSQFHVSASHTFVSPLIGNSMVHIKVIMDGTAVVVPMVRSIVFVHARERILTKLLQGGVPLVETKRRKLVVRKMDGSVAVIEDNPTWRTVMDMVSEAGRPQARTSEGDIMADTKTVVKLTLYLTDGLCGVSDGTCASY